VFGRRRIGFMELRTLMMGRKGVFGRRRIGFMEPRGLIIMRGEGVWGMRGRRFYGVQRRCRNRTQTAEASENLRKCWERKFEDSNS
jgi:hypothetical protein